MLSFDQAVAEHMARGLDIRFQHLVKSIQWGSAGVTAGCENGASFAADAAIVTVSLGVLKVRTPQKSGAARDCQSFHSSLSNYGVFLIMVVIYSI